MGRKSNEDLAAEAVALAQELGMEADDLNLDQSNKELSDLVADLRAQFDKQEGNKTPEKPAAEKPKEPEKSAVVKPPYTVADGKSVACRKGVIDAGQEMKPEYLAGGREVFDGLLKRGIIVKN